VFPAFPHPKVFVGDFCDAGLGAVNGARATFHSLRKSFVTLLANAGVDQAHLFKLARHSDPRLTAAVYTDGRLMKLSLAVSRLPAAGCDNRTDFREKSGSNSRESADMPYSNDMQRGNSPQSAGSNSNGATAAPSCVPASNEPANQWAQQDLNLLRPSVTPRGDRHGEQGRQGVVGGVHQDPPLGGRTDLGRRRDCDCKDSGAGGLEGQEEDRREQLLSGERGPAGDPRLTLSDSDRRTALGVLLSTQDQQDRSTLLKLLRPYLPIVLMTAAGICLAAASLHLTMGTEPVYTTLELIP
jgi:hypothetical protein